MNNAKRLRRAATLCAAFFAVCMLSGCSLFVMAGKMLFGDPVMTCEFKKATTIDLARDEKTILVVCTTPESIKSQWTSVDAELIDRVTRKLKLQNIKVIHPDKVSRWLDDNGGTFSDPAELADHFKTDYIIHIDLENVTYTEENSPDLYRGRVRGNIVTYGVKKQSGTKFVGHVFEREFSSEYPQYPVSSEHVSAKVFQLQCMDRVSSQVTFLFYDHRMSEEVE